MFATLKNKITECGGEQFLYFSGISIASYAAANVLFLGYSVYVASGIIGALLVFLICSSLLYAASLSLLRVSVPRKLTSLDLVSHYFGAHGARFCALVLALTLLGWFLWQLSFCVHFVRDYAIVRMPIFKVLSEEKLGVALGLFCCAVACSDKVGLRIVSVLFVPVLLFLLCCLFFFLSFYTPTHLAVLSTIDFSTLSILFGSLTTLIMFSPTFFKSATSVDIARRSIKLTYLIILPLFYVSGVFFGMFSPSNNILNIAYLPSGIGPFVLTAFVLICGINICSTNLLYGADVITQVTSSKSRMPVVFMLSSVGVLFYGLVSSKVKADIVYIEFLGSLVMGMLSIILTKTIASNFRIDKESLEQQRGNYLALLVSYGVGLFVWTGVFHITGVPFFDVALSAFIMCLYYMRFPPKLRIFDWIRHKEWDRSSVH